MQITCVVEVSGIDTVMALIHSLALRSPWCVSQNTTSPILPEHGKKKLKVWFEEVYFLQTLIPVAVIVCVSVWFSTKEVHNTNK